MEPDAAPLLLPAGTGPLARDIAVLHRPGKAPGLFWLGGFRSDMTGTKAVAIDAYAAARGLAATRLIRPRPVKRRFGDGTISALAGGAARFDTATTGRQIVMSSMGGWIAPYWQRSATAVA